jgi:hypothetical protein
MSSARWRVRSHAFGAGGIPAGSREGFVVDPEEPLEDMKLLGVTSFEVSSVRPRLRLARHRAHTSRASL